MKSFGKKLLSALMSLLTSVCFSFGIGKNFLPPFMVSRRQKIHEAQHLYLEHAKVLETTLNGTQLTHRSHSSHKSHYSSSSSHSSSSSNYSSSSFSNTSSSTININHPPVALDKKVTITEDATEIFKIEATDKDKDKLNYAIVTQPEHGDLNIMENQVTYIPKKDYFGPDKFNFKVNDGFLDSGIAEVSIKVLPLNDAPVAESQDISIIKNNSRVIVLAATDVDNEILKYEVQQHPHHGNLIGAGSNLTYIPEPNYDGADSFIFKVNDGKLSSKPAIVSIAIRSENIAPKSINSTVDVTKEIPKEIILQATDEEKDKLVYFIASLPGHGKLVGEIGDSKLMYHPNPGYIGTDSFSFKANDSFSDSNIGTISIHIMINEGK